MADPEVSSSRRALPLGAPLTRLPGPPLMVECTELATTGTIIGPRDRVEWKCRVHPDGPPLFSHHDDEEEAEWVILERLGKMLIQSLTFVMGVFSRDFLKTAKVSGLS